MASDSFLRAFEKTVTKLLAQWSPSRTEWFKDESQLHKVQEVIESRFANAKSQEECRYLMRLRWHFCMSYQEVSYDELLHFVSPDKMARLNLLFDHMADQNYSAIDSWLVSALQEMELADNHFDS